MGRHLDPNDRNYMPRLNDRGDRDERASDSRALNFDDGPDGFESGGGDEFNYEDDYSEDYTKPRKGKSASKTGGEVKIRGLRPGEYTDIGTDEPPGISA